MSGFGRTLAESRLARNPYNIAVSAYFRYVARRLGLVAERADDIQYNGQILDVILEKIKKYGFIIGDLPGNNANVFYEVGNSHRISPRRPSC
jgi:hypothetical protein